MTHSRSALSFPGLLALALLSACRSAPPEAAPSSRPAPAPFAAAAPSAAADRPAPKAPAAKDTWRPLFDGKTLDGWKKSEFGGEAEPRVAAGQLILPLGEPMTGVTWTRDFPKVDYEIELEAMRVDGHDFFCGLTFPVKESAASLILGGWGGGVCGLSCINGMDASENETTGYRDFVSDRWYRVRVRVGKETIEAWLGEEKIVDVETTGKRIDIRADISASKPLGLATWRTAAAIRDLKWRPTGG